MSDLTSVPEIVAIIAAARTDASSWKRRTASCRAAGGVVPSMRTCSMLARAPRCTPSSMWRWCAKKTTLWTVRWTWGLPAKLGPRTRSAAPVEALAT